MTINNKKIAYFFFFSVCFSLFPSFLTLAKVDAVSDHGFIIENAIETDASVPQSWRALVSNVDAWWPKDHSWWRGTFSIDAAAGGVSVKRVETPQHNIWQLVLLSQTSN